MTKDFNLQHHNTFGVAAEAAVFAEFHTVAELQSLLEQRPTDQPISILGGGSNVILPQQVAGWVLHNRIDTIELVEENENWVIVAAGGGVIWHDLVLWSLRQGYGGLENMALIPGTVGAAPIQNIGAYGREVKDVFVSLTAVQLNSKQAVEFSPTDCQFGYRDSFFKQAAHRGRYCITEVRLQLTKGKHTLSTHYGAISQQLETWGITQPQPSDVAAAVIEIRRSKLPDWRQHGNAGSFFKNPIITKQQYEQLKTKHPELPSYPVDDERVKVPAGWLIDQAGWKGKRIGAVGCYPKQALVVVNHENATGEEIIAFGEMVANDVKMKYGIQLQREVNELIPQMP